MEGVDLCRLRRVFQISRLPRIPIHHNGSFNSESHLEKYKL